MGERLRAPGLLLAAFVLEGRAAATVAEPDASASSVCAPACGADQSCVGSRCVPVVLQQPAQTPASAPPPVWPSLTGDAPPARPPRTRRKKPALFMPFVGIHSYQQAEAFNTDAGLRFGALVGGRLNDRFSLNGELHVDITNPGDLPEGNDFSEFAYSVAFSPLMELPASGAEFVLGPKIGMVSVVQNVTDATGSAHTSGFGLVLGGNAGVFAAMSRAASFGVLFSFELARVEVICDYGCHSTTIAPPISKILAVTAAALF